MIRPSGPSFASAGSGSSGSSSMPSASATSVEELRARSRCTRPGTRGGRAGRRPRASAVTALSSLHHRAVPGAGRVAVSRIQAMPFSAVSIEVEPQVVADRDGEAADLADRLGAALEQVGVVVDQPVRAQSRRRPPRRRRTQHDVARRRARPSRPQSPDHRQHHRVHVLHVDRAAAPDVAVLRSRRRTGARDHSAASAGTTSRWPCTSSAPRRGSAPAMRATTLARPRLRLVDLRLEPDLGELAGDVLGGLARSPGAAAVAGVGWCRSGSARGRARRPRPAAPGRCGWLRLPTSSRSCHRPCSPTVVEASC